MTAHDFTKALCTGKSTLFESVLLADHDRAAELCARCPVIDSCSDLLEAELAAASSRSLIKCGGGPEGTWAGHLVTRSGKVTKPREHGTERGYYQHRYRKETACRECKDAHAATIRRAAS